MDDPDLRHLARWREGDRAAGQALFERHFESLYRFFRSKCEGNCDELVQSTLLACLDAKQQFRGDSRFRTYLFTILVPDGHRASKSWLNATTDRLVRAQKLENYDLIVTS